MSWDTTKPAGNRSIRLGDDDIREFKQDVELALTAEGSFPVDAANPKYYWKPSKGTEGSRPTGTDAPTGRVYINESRGEIERYNGASWDPVATLIPAGLLSPYAGSSAPNGWLLCDGSAVSRTTYARLFAAIGIAHGSGDGSTTFNLPDGRGRFLRGVDGGTGRDPDAASRTAMGSGGNTGDAVGTVQDEQYKSHSHAVTDPGHAHTERYASGGATPGGMVASPGDGSTNTNSYNTTVSQVTGLTVNANGGNETRPKNFNVNYIIKY